MSTKIEELPDECLVVILSLTSPEDILRSSAVSKQFFSVAISDDLWKKLLPSDYDQIINDYPIRFYSLKDLFLILYRSHLLIHQNTKSLSLDKRSWKKCYMLGSRSLTIAWGDNPQYWSWNFVPESRFPENANLESVCWLHIKGVFPTKLLSRNTSYGAYFVFKLAEGRVGFKGVPIQVSLSESDEQGLPLNHCQTTSTNSVYLSPPEVFDSEEEHEEELDDLLVPTEREDGWMEIAMGTYQVGNASESVFLEMILRETEELYWKSGLLIHGIELRPLID